MAVQTSDMIYVPPSSPLNVAMQERTSPTTPATPRARAAPCRGGGPCRCQVRDHEVMRSLSCVATPSDVNSRTFLLYYSDIPDILHHAHYQQRRASCKHAIALYPPPFSLALHIFLINKSLFHNIFITGPAGIGYGSIT